MRHDPVVAEWRFDEVTLEDSARLAGAEIMDVLLREHTVRPSAELVLHLLTYLPPEIVRQLGAIWGQALEAPYVVRRFSGELVEAPS